MIAAGSCKPPELETTDLVAHAARLGHRVTDRQIERWRAAGLLPRAQRSGRGQGRGTKWLYPPGTVESLEALLKLRIDVRSIPELGVRLWRAGYPIEISVARTYLARCCITHQRIKRKVREVGALAAGEALADDIARTVASRQAFADTPWTYDSYDRAVRIGENIFGAFVNPKHVATDETIAFAKRRMRITGEEERSLLNFGADLDGELAQGLKVFAQLDSAVIEASDEDMLLARTLAPHMVLVAEQLADLSGKVAEPLLTFFGRVAQVDLRSTVGLAVVVGIVRLLRSQGIGDALTRVSTVADSLAAAQRRVSESLANAQ